LAVNDLSIDGKKPTVYASPVIVDGRLYIRTGEHLYCFGQKAAAVGTTSGWRSDWLRCILPGTPRDPS
jgi:hypothetical protein